MSRAFYVLLTAVLLQNYLFYNQSTGLNVLAYSLLVLGLVYVRKADSFRHPTIQLSVLGLLLSGGSASLYGGSPAVLLYFASLFLLVGYSSIPRLSPYVSAFNGLLSSVGLASFEASSQWFASSNSTPTHRQLIRQFRILLLPFLITIVFYGLYYWANPDFSLFENSYTLDSNYILLTILGFIWLPSLLFPYSAQLFTKADLKLSNTVTRIRSRYSGHLLGLKWEYRQGVAMLGMLNLLLFVFLGFESLMLNKGRYAATAFELSQSVHDSVNVLILSILLAISLVLFYFRRNLNFFPKNRLLMQLAYTWIVLNLLLLGVTTYTNTLYVQNYGLTYKRIGVYLWLFLTGCGLLSTLYKIHSKKSNAFLFRVNSWICYFALILLSAVPWAEVITQYNLTKARTRDLSYLFQLMPYNLPQLQAYVTTHPELKDTLIHQTQAFQNRYRKRPQTWQSWNYLDWKTNQYAETHPLSK